MTVNMEQSILTDDTHMVVYGYYRIRWRTIATYVFSTLLCGIPFLLFHWCPTWFLYATSKRCTFQIADCVLVVERYQKKYKSYYIHKICYKNIADVSGLLNLAFTEESGNEKDTVENVDETQNTLIYLEDGSTLDFQNYCSFRHKKESFVWDESRALWCRLGGLECGATCAQLHATGATPPTSEGRFNMLLIYGLNMIIVPVQTVWTLVLLEVFNPFYMFQLFAIGVWLAEEYYYYCVAIAIMSAFGVTTSVVQTKRNQTKLRKTVEASETVQLWDGRELDSRTVVPGDVIALNNRCTLQFDAVLLGGSAVLNESMLTGESVPITKTALLQVDRPFSLKEHASSVLFCGTRVIQTKNFNGEPARALVLRTGYNTSKGQLVRSILYPVPADFKFDRDSYKFIIILAGLALLGLIYTIALKAHRGISAGEVALKALDIITIAIPPALPAAMTVGRLFAVTRLKRKKISCLNTRAVNVCGSIDCLCFDKTGTLTEDSLDMWGVVPVLAGSQPVQLDEPQREPAQLDESNHLKQAMACCHSLTLLDGELVGDPLDLKMFESTKWVLEEGDIFESSSKQILAPTVVKPDFNNYCSVLPPKVDVGILQQHQFVSSLQRASVVTKGLNEDVLRVFCKGAPEMLKTLCIAETVPDNLFEVLNSYAAKGYRVIACATRVLDVTAEQLQNMNREEVECELEFLGLVIMGNRLKAATTNIIRELKEANIHVVMITGDNVLTAVSVATECEILKKDERIVHLRVDGSAKTPVIYCENVLNGNTLGHRQVLDNDSGRGSWHASGTRSNINSLDVEASKGLRYKIVMTGDTWKVLRDHYPSVLPRVIERGAVFARMTSDQKQQLIVEYQALGYYVGMCGDGANDCGALRAAHTGISLSELESSVAAPFTSANPDIVCVDNVLREGRAALSTSFGVFKFMVAYSLTQLFSVSFLYYFDSNLTDIQFLYVDFFLAVNFSFLFGLTAASTGKLSKNPHSTSLLGFIPLFSLFGQLILIGVGQFLAYYALTLFPWYERHTYQGEYAIECHENYVIFATSMFQYILLALVFSHGAPYRKSVITNISLIISVLIITGFSIFITIKPGEWLADFFQLIMPEEYLLSYIILAIAGTNFILALLFERLIVEYLMEYKKCIPWFLKEKQVMKTPHLLIRRELTDMDYLGFDSVIKYDNDKGKSVVESSVSR